MDRLDSYAAHAEEATLGALLRCCARELCGPRGELRTAGPYLLLRVAGTRLRVRAGGGTALRLRGPAEWLADGGWRPLRSDQLVELVARELGGGNEEFAAQVAASREAIATLLAAREHAAPPADPWLASEQALVTGHPFHPSPKAHGGADWARYAPEAHARFPLRMLAVRADLAVGQGDRTALDALGTAPPGYLLLPVHPWQFDLLAAELRAPLSDGRLLDLGPGAHPVIPTSSVRTVYEPAAGVCLKFSLNVRITNCLRKNAWYELAGAVELTRRLRPVFRRLAERFPGTRWLPEPGYRSAALDTPLLEGLGVIVRSGPVCAPGVTPILAGALAAAPYRRAAGGAPGDGDRDDPAGAEPGVPEPVRERRRTDPVGWWRAYVERVALPVLAAFDDHGVVLEPHVQNVLVGIDQNGLPAEVIFRDMEGTKLVAGRHDLSGLPERVTASVVYPPAQGWRRIAYCLMVNHLAEVAATVAERAAMPAAHREEDMLRLLWATARHVLERHAEAHGRTPALTALLSGPTLPAKANLGVRWRRNPDRAAGYVPVPNPLAAATATAPAAALIGAETC